ncbi:unnamed protein product [Blepharisma stoltei]|uniref:Uncharacterized protein n=1 Tax=Blepharisma stoltei TaxID=1481888 RepID=A0AAU9J468_9CILI|nr:unnamed protein product [Blepharisma stoltei]
MSVLYQEAHSYQISVVDSLINDAEAWKNTQDVVFLTMQAFYEILKLHGSKIGELDHLPAPRDRAEDSNLSTQRKWSGTQVFEIYEELNKKPSLDEVNDLIKHKLANLDRTSPPLHDPSQDDIDFDIESNKSIRELDEIREEIREIKIKISEAANHSEIRVIYDLLENKANIPDIWEALQQKANKQAVNNVLAKKANTSDFENLMAIKADNKIVQELISKVDEKIDISAMENATKDLEKRINKEIEDFKKQLLDDFSPVSRTDFDIEIQKFDKMVDSIYEQNANSIKNIENTVENMIRSKLEKNREINVSQAIDRSMIETMNNQLRDEIKEMKIFITGDIRNKITEINEKFDSVQEKYNEQRSNEEYKLKLYEEEIFKLKASQDSLISLKSDFKKVFQELQKSESERKNQLEVSEFCNKSNMQTLNLLKNSVESLEKAFHANNYELSAHVKQTDSNFQSQKSYFENELKSNKNEFFELFNKLDANLLWQKRQFDEQLKINKEELTKILNNPGFQAADNSNFEGELKLVKEELIKIVNDFQTNFEEEIKRNRTELDKFSNKLENDLQRQEAFLEEKIKLSKNELNEASNKFNEKLEELKKQAREDMELNKGEFNPIFNDFELRLADLKNHIDELNSKNSKSLPQAKFDEKEISKLHSLYNDLLQKIVEIEESLSKKIDIKDFNSALQNSEHMKIILSSLSSKADEAAINELIKIQEEISQLYSSLKETVEHKMAHEKSSKDIEEINIIDEDYELSEIENIKMTQDEFALNIKKIEGILEKKADIEEINKKVSEEMLFNLLNEKVDYKLYEYLASSQNEILLNIENLDKILQGKAEKNDLDIKVSNKDLKELLSNKADTISLIEFQETVKKNLKDLEAKIPPKRKNTDLSQEKILKETQAYISASLSKFQIGEVKILQEKFTKELEHIKTRIKSFVKSDIFETSTREIYSILNTKLDSSSLSEIINNQEEIMKTIENLNFEKKDENQIKALVEAIDNKFKKLKLDINTKFSSFKNEKEHLFEELRKENEKSFEYVLGELRKKASNKEIKGILDAKINAEEYKHDLAGFITKDDYETNILEQSLINEILLGENCLGKWLWKSGKETNNYIPWETEISNTCPTNFIWKPNTIEISVIAPGLYEISYGFYSSKKPNITVYINDEIAIEDKPNPNKRWIRHSDGNISGLSNISFIALPARANIRISYTCEKKGEGFLSLRKI